jgi:hypothetical protein
LPRRGKMLARAVEEDGKPPVHPDIQFHARRVGMNSASLKKTCRS